MINMLNVLQGRAVEPLGSSATLPEPEQLARRCLTEPQMAYGLLHPDLDTLTFPRPPRVCIRCHAEQEFPQSVQCAGFTASDNKA